MNCIIIDDEPLALGIVKSYCEELGGIEVMGTFTNPLESMSLFQEGNIDLVFLDIEMPQITGIEFVKTLDKRPFFIFTTAYPQYAIDGFELNAVDYLVKPIPFPRFVKSINRVKELKMLKNSMSTEEGNLASASGAQLSDNQFIFVKSDYGNVKIKLEDIKYIQGLKDYLKIHTSERKPILTLMNFRDIEAKLANTDFVRVHRSFLVNVNNIDSIQRSKIVMDDIRIPIGESYKDEFMKRLGL
ncbi:LytTR family DNA-binding domain-containing protein [Ulvibacterium sp.]|uniref:LytR/AlgR family response regulator transcription factor n=1 Tax=Ulvibacterium sp. TaxID=2665914 RepID=UPI00260B1D86|nr:LytTR family DNA-binding domain-containing protein [Ulvibacterium sp.]